MALDLSGAYLLIINIMTVQQIDQRTHHLHMRKILSADIEKQIFAD